MSRALTWAVATWLALGAAACGGPRRADAEASAVEQRQRAALEELRRFGGTAFEVVSFKPGEELLLDTHWDYMPLRVYILQFDAEVRWREAVEIASLDELNRRIAAPDWSFAGAEREFLLERVFGPGRHGPGEATAIQTAASFVDLEPGWRFTGFGQQR